MIVITGAGGMLGRAIVDRLLREPRSDQDFVALTHKELEIHYDLSVLGYFQHDVPLSEGDVLINCAGVRQASQYNDAVTMSRANTLGPHVLAKVSAELGFRMIHVSTDCVYSANERRAPVMHRVGDPTAPDTLYGRTKLAGEPYGSTVTVVRTSFVGPEHGLWRSIAEAPKHNYYEGWTNAWWSGSTVDEVAKALIDIARTRKRPIGQGIEQVCTTEPISKLEAVKILALRLNRTDIRVTPVAGPRIDRSMKPTYEVPSLTAATAPVEVSA